MNKKGQGEGWIIVAVIVALLLFIGGIYILKSTGPWWKEVTGKSALREAEWSKQIAVEEAKAIKESATLLAEAEVERAKGVAKANAIIGESLKGNDAYLRYLWINGLHNGQGEIIYVATEAGLPILEANRFK